MQGGGELDIKFSVIFGQAMFTIGLLAHLHVGNRVAAFFDIGDFGGGVFGGVVKHGDGNHGWQAASNAAGIEKVEAYLVGAVVNYVCGVPGIDGRADGVGLRAVGSVMNDVVQAAVGQSASIDFANGVSEAVALVSRTVSVAGVGGCGHYDAEKFCFYGRGGEF